MSSPQSSGHLLSRSYQDALVCSRAAKKQVTECQMCYWWAMPDLMQTALALIFLKKPLKLIAPRFPGPGQRWGHV